LIQQNDNNILEPKEIKMENDENKDDADVEESDDFGNFEDAPVTSQNEALASSEVKAQITSDDIVEDKEDFEGFENVVSSNEAANNAVSISDAFGSLVDTEDEVLPSAKGSENNVDSDKPAFSDPHLEEDAEVYVTSDTIQAFHENEIDSASEENTIDGDDENNKASGEPWPAISISDAFGSLIDVGDVALPSLESFQSRNNNVTNFDQKDKMELNGTNGINDEEFGDFEDIPDNLKKNDDNETENTRTDSLKRDPNDSMMSESDDFGDFEDVSPQAELSQPLENVDESAAASARNLTSKEKVSSLFPAVCNAVQNADKLSIFDSMAESNNYLSAAAPLSDSSQSWQNGVLTSQQEEIDIKDDNFGDFENIKESETESLPAEQEQNSSESFGDFGDFEDSDGVIVDSNIDLKGSNKKDDINKTESSHYVTKDAAMFEKGDRFNAAFGDFSSVKEISLDEKHTDQEEEQKPQISYGSKETKVNETNGGFDVDFGGFSVAQTTNKISKPSSATNFMIEKTTNDGFGDFDGFKTTDENGRKDDSFENFDSFQSSNNTDDLLGISFGEQRGPASTIQNTSQQSPDFFSPDDGKNSSVKNSDRLPKGWSFDRIIQCSIEDLAEALLYAEMLEEGIKGSLLLSLTVITFAFVYFS